MLKNTIFITQLLQFLTIIFLPLYIIRFSLPVSLGNIEINLPSTFLEVLILLTLFFSFILFLFFRPKNLIATKINTLVLLFLLSSVIALLYTPNLISGLGIFRAYFLEPILFFYSLLLIMLFKEKKFIFYALIISGVWISLLAILQKLTGSYSLAPYELAQGRVPAVYNSANAVALYLGPILILVAGLFLKSKNSLNKFLYLLMIILFSAAIILTRSRGGLISVVISLLIFLSAIFAVKNTNLKKVWFLIPLGIFLAIIFFFYQFYQNYSTFSSASHIPYTYGDTLQIRYFIWSGTIDLLKDQPVLGAGLNGFKTLYTNQYRLPQYQEEFQYPHNLILTFWAETGLFGLIIFIFLLTTLIILIIKNLEKKDLILGATFLGMLSYIILHGLVDVPYFKNDLSMQFWIILALIIFWLKEKKFKENK